MSTRKACGLLLPPLIALFLLLMAAPVLAMGLGVTPARLNIEVSRGGSASATLNVVNTAGDESSFKVYVEEEDYKGWFTIEPEEFTLSSQENKAVQITVSPPQDASGQHQVRICVVSMLPGDGLRIGAGIKVPTPIHILSMAGWILPVSIGVALLAIAIIVVFALWRRRVSY